LELGESGLGPFIAGLMALGTGESGLLFGEMMDNGGETNPGCCHERIPSVPPGGLHGGVAELRSAYGVFDVAGESLGGWFWQSK